jgi:hypothetical protein
MTADRDKIDALAADILAMETQLGEALAECSTLRAECDTLLAANVCLRDQIDALALDLRCTVQMPGEINGA